MIVWRKFIKGRKFPAHRPLNPPVKQITYDVFSASSKHDAILLDNFITRLEPFINDQYVLFFYQRYACKYLVIEDKFRKRDFIVNRGGLIKALERERRGMSSCIEGLMADLRTFVLDYSYAAERPEEAWE